MSNRSFKDETIDNTPSGIDRQFGRSNCCEYLDREHPGGSWDGYLENGDTELSRGSCVSGQSEAPAWRPACAKRHEVAPG